MKTWSIARTDLLRTLRDRSNLVSMIVVPLVFVFFLGSIGSESRPTVAIAGSGAVADAVADQLEASDAVELRRADDAAEARDLVGAGRAALGVVVPDDAATTWSAGQPVEVELVSSADGSGSDLQPLVAGALRRLALAPAVAAHLAAAPGAPPLPDVRAAVERRVQQYQPSTVDVVDATGHEATPGGGQARTATQQLVLMVFLFSLYSAIPMGQTRTLGVAHRMLASPTSMRSVVGGAALGRWLVAVAQGAYIMVATALIFGVAWGSLPAAIIVLAAFSAVGAGLGTLIGASFDDEGVLVGIATLVGLVVAAVGGAMLPGELFNGTIETISELTPHAWAIDAFTELRDGAGLAAIATELTLLAALSCVLLAAAAVRLRSTLRHT